MKVSQEKKKEIRKELIAAAVEIITEKGFKAATMREISAKAGYGSATIYNYFPTKEKILYAYFEDSHEQAALTLEQIPDLPEFTLKEKLQVQLESLLDVYLQDREFVMEAYKLIFDSPLRTFSEFVPIRDRFTAQVRLFIETAIENGEVPEHPFGSFILNLYWDYSGLMTLFWFNDDSEGFSNTSSLIDMSLDIIVEVLKSGLIPKSMDIFSFLFRSYMFNSMDSLKKLFSIKDAFKDGFGDLKSNG